MTLRPRALVTFEFVRRLPKTSLLRTLAWAKSRLFLKAQKEDQKMIDDGSKGDTSTAKKAKRPHGTSSIWQPEGSSIWHIQYFRNGKRHRESARTDNKTRANLLLKKRQAEITTGNFVGPRGERILVSELNTRLCEIPSTSNKAGKQEAGERVSERAYELLLRRPRRQNVPDSFWPELL